jgi:hypothetical protein
MLYRITPLHSVNPEKVVAIKTDSRTDSYSEPHVTIMFEDRLLELPPEYSLEEITAALNGGCYYRQKWTDECGDIDVCVIHDEVSDSEETWNPLRYCRKREPKYILKSVTQDHLVERERLEQAEDNLGPIARFFAKKGSS